MKTYKNRALWTKIGWLIGLVVSAVLFGVSLSFVLSNNYSLAWNIVTWVSLAALIVTLVFSIVALVTVRCKEFKSNNLNLWVYAGISKGVLGVDDKVLDRDGNLWIPKYNMNAKVEGHQIEVKTSGRNISLKVDEQLVE